MMTPSGKGTTPSQGDTSRRTLTHVLVLLAALSLMTYGLVCTSHAASADDIDMDAEASERVAPDAKPIKEPAAVGSDTDAHGRTPGTARDGTPPLDGGSTTRPSDTAAGSAAWLVSSGASLR